MFSNELYRKIKESIPLTRSPVDSASLLNLFADPNKAKLQLNTFLSELSPTKEQAIKMSKLGIVTKK